MRSESVKSILAIVWSVTETSSAQLFPCGLLFPPPPPTPPSLHPSTCFLALIFSSCCLALTARLLSHPHLQPKWKHLALAFFSTGCRIVIFTSRAIGVAEPCCCCVCVEDELSWSVSHIKTFLPVCVGEKHSKIIHGHII